MLVFNMAEKITWNMTESRDLAEILRSCAKQVLIIDSRSFLEYNTLHVNGAVNVCCSKLVKRRLQQDKVSVKDMLTHAGATVPDDADQVIIVYDQCTSDPNLLSADCFMMVLLKKLIAVFNHVSLLKGGFLEFQATHPSLCESKTSAVKSSGNYKCPPLTSMSQPCLPVSNLGPTKILPFLYLGSQHDALSRESMQVIGINYILNVSTSCPKPPFIPDGHFLRIPVNDNYSDKLLPFFQDAFQFLDKVREGSGCVMVHCLAGISRSATVAIAYIMRYLNMSTDDAYKYVKDKRPTISPNFNFLGQLLEFEKQMKQQRQQESEEAPESAAAHKRQCIAELRSPTSPTVATPKFLLRPQVDSTSVQSPTTALAKLNFGQAGTPENPTGPQEGELPFPQIPTTSLDQLSFTPCFAKDDSPLRLTGLASPPRTSGGGTKRPLSMSALESQSIGSVQAVVPMDTSDSLSNTQVTLRSSETKAKRPTVRPNSIAFSSVPKFDFPSLGSSHSLKGANAFPSVTLTSTAEIEIASPLPSGMDSKDRGGGSCTSASVSASSALHQSSASLPMSANITTTDSITSTSSPASTSQSSSSSSSSQQRTIQVRSSSASRAEIDDSKQSKNGSGGHGVPQHMHHSTSTPSNISSARNLEQGRKSRSMEDILNSPDEEPATTDCGCIGNFGWNKSKQRTLNAADLFSQPVTLENVRCRGRSDPHQSSSSISSSGSHNSLHGSLEIIQVS